MVQCDNSESEIVISRRIFFALALAKHHYYFYFLAVRSWRGEWGVTVCYRGLNLFLFGNFRAK